MKKLSPPETFRLPRVGERDPHFGLSRSHYYALNKCGTIKFRRSCRQGKSRGVTLIDYDQVHQHIFGRAA